MTRTIKTAVLSLAAAFTLAGCFQTVPVRGPGPLPRNYPQYPQQQPENFHLRGNYDIEDRVALTANLRNANISETVTSKDRFNERSVHTIFASLREGRNNPYYEESRRTSGANYSIRVSWSDRFRMTPQQTFQHNRLHHLYNTIASRSLFGNHDRINCVKEPGENLLKCRAR